MDKCKHCGGPLGTQVEMVYFKEGEKQLYYTHDFARWHANANGHDPDSIVEWLQAARSSKAGLVMGYKVPTGRPGYDGRGAYCSMDCEAGAASARGMVAPAASDAPHARAAIVSDLSAADKIDAAALRSIRERMQLTQPDFAQALGYKGNTEVRRAAVSRLERGERAPSDRVRLRALMLENGLREKGL